MNYLFAFALCVAGTVMTALAGGDDLYWLLVSDANVALFLFIAWLLESQKRSTITVRNDVQLAGYQPREGKPANPPGSE